MRRARALMCGVVIAGLGDLAIGAGLAHGGQHEYGVLIPHINPQLEYSFPADYEGRSDLRNSRDAMYEGQVNPDQPVIWFAMAAFDDSPGPIELAGATFGFRDYDPSKISFAEFGACNEGYLELPSSAWPGPEEGTAVLYDPDRRPTSRLVELYWFVSYVYAPVSIEFGVNPRIAVPQAAFGGPPEPSSVLDDVYDFGIIGFGEAGYNPLAPTTQPGACCVVDMCYLVEREDCESLGGRFEGANTDCFPNPCDRPTIDISWSNVKRLFR